MLYIWPQCSSTSDLTCFVASDVGKNLFVSLIRCPNESKSLQIIYKITGGGHEITGGSHES